MPHDTLETLLRAADSAAPPPSRATDDLARHIRRIAPRRIRATALVTGLLFLTAGLFHLRPSPSAHHAADQPIDSAHSTQNHLADARTELDRLLTEASHREATVAILLQYERQRHALAASQRLLADGDPADQIRRHQDRSALILFHQADRKYTHLRQLDAARAEYQRLLDLYPDSHWAALAQARLREIEG